jgi:hypothetical protein
MLGLRRNNSGAESAALLREIAERCASATLSQLRADVDQMSTAQLRGYVRAHAWPLVWDEAQQATATGRRSISQTNDLAARALEQTVHLVTANFHGSPIVAIPVPHIGRRAAA